MDKDRILALAGLLEKSEVVKDPKTGERVHFDMHSFKAVKGFYLKRDEKINFGNCKTAACIAGWAVIVFGEGKEWEDCGSTEVEATELLALSEEEGKELFLPSDKVDPISEEVTTDYYSAKAAQAAKVLRHLAATGKVEWDKAFEEGGGRE